MTVYEAMQIFSVLFPVVLTLYLHWVSLGYQAKLSREIAKYPFREKAYENLLNCMDEFMILLDTSIHTDKDYFLKFQSILFKMTQARETIDPSNRSMFLSFATEKLQDMGGTLNNGNKSESTKEIRKIISECITQIGRTLNKREADTLK